MKILFRILFLSIFILTSCKSDNFYETKRIIETDKEEYNIGDTIKLTLKIIPIEDKKEIRVYENFKNLEVSFALINGQTEVHNESWSERSGEKLPETKTKVISITQDRPFEKKFHILTTSESKKVILEIPELKLKTEFDKKRILTDSIRIHAYCNPINPEVGASLEEYFEVKDIKININE